MQRDAPPTGLTDIYRPSLALLTDLYQLTMAYGYWKSGMADHDATFHLFFRRPPFRGGYAIACGLAYAIDYLQAFRFTPGDLDYLGTLTGNDGRPLFEPGFLQYLGDMRLSVDVDAMPEGTVAFAHEPLVRLKGPLIQCQLVETPLLNIINFQTLIATKASRVAAAARGEPVLEFGLRRAQGIDGALAASRAAYLGGCAATSNVLAGRLFSIPVKGTHAHSWVMAFDTETASFEAYAAAMPNNCVFLVDTYDTLRGVERAIEVGHKLRAAGHEMAGVRLDSGDLAELSIGARQLLDAAGFPDAAIVASNDLDELEIERLKARGATIAVWGVGTNLVTAKDQPALGGVYKLAAIRGPGEPWRYRLKLSEQPIKISNPGILQVRRYRDGTRPREDVIFDEGTDLTAGCTSVDVAAPDRRRTIAATATEHTDLLVPVFRGGALTYPPPPLEALREHARAQLEAFDPATRRLTGATPYPVGLESGLHALKLELMDAARHADR